MDKSPEMKRLAGWPLTVLLFAAWVALALIDEACKAAARAVRRLRDVACPCGCHPATISARACRQAETMCPECGP